MAAFRTGPTAITTSVANILNVPTTTGGVGLSTPLLAVSPQQIHVVNKGAAVATFSIWLGATGGSAAGTELWTAVSVAVGGYFNDYFVPGLRMVAADFLTAQASANTHLVITITGQLWVVG